jgi:hypothetical protein
MRKPEKPRLDWIERVLATADDRERPGPAQLRIVGGTGGASGDDRTPEGKPAARRPAHKQGAP